MFRPEQILSMNFQPQPRNLQLL